jgi:hypothetical protein
MRPEQRKNKRKPVRCRAWVSTGKAAPPIDCMVFDISDSGARLELKPECDLPSAFILMFTANGKASRLCDVVWRDGSLIGVRFKNMTIEEAERYQKQRPRVQQSA